ncbi:pilin [Acinetobacter brisouii]
MNAQKGFTLIELMIVVAIIGILAAIAIPAYQNYITKSQVTRAVAELGAMKTAYEDCLNNGQTAANACQIGWTGSNIQYLTTPTLQNAVSTPSATNGIALSSTGTISGTFGGSASAALKDGTAKTVTWTRTASGTWSCASTADAKYKPVSCGG